LKLLVLGCGPAGLMAVHAGIMSGHEVINVSKARKSHMRGAQYLHEPIPLATASGPFSVRYSLRGSPDDYRAKVYGDGYRGAVSPEDLPEDHLAWDIRGTYDFLWESYGSTVIEQNLVDPNKVSQILDWCKPDLTISTIPAPLLCRSDCAFTNQEIWSNDMDVLSGEDNTVVCNGEKAPAWYRAAKIQNYTTVEWPSFSRPPIYVHSVIKPLKTTCTCLRDIVRMGRYGKWEKGVLSHSAFFETIELLKQPEQLKIL
jgi:hypothetical protein